MENILELLYDLDLSGGKTYGPNSPFARAARVKNEKLELLNASLTAEQKEWLETYFVADGKIEGIIGFDRFRFAFHLGARLIEGKEEAL